MLKSILVLRIHMYELEKVNELCQDFADRYIETLKVKLNSDNIFKNEEDDLDLENSDERFVDDDSELNSSHKSSSKSSSNNSNFNNNGDNLNEDELNRKQGRLNKNKLKKLAKSTSTPVKKSTLIPFEISPDTCLSKISFNMLNLNSNNDCSYQSSGSNDLEDELNDCETGNKSNFYEQDENNNDEDDENVYDDDDDDEDEDLLDRDDDSSVKSPKANNSSSKLLNKNLKSFNNINDDSYFKRNIKTKRGILPKNATTVMKKWLFQHIVVSFNIFNN
jgi:hypothetical protein